MKEKVQAGIFPVYFSKIRKNIGLYAEVTISGIRHIYFAEFRAKKRKGNTRENVMCGQNFAIRRMFKRRDVR